MMAPITLGAMALDVSTGLLSGPRGAVYLDMCHCALLQRLTRQPGVLVSQSDLIAAVYPDTDAEPEHADVRLRQLVARLRAVIAALGAGSNTITAEPRVGYRIGSHRQTPLRTGHA